MNTRRILSALLLCLLMTAGASAKKLAKEPETDLSQLDFRAGDIVFQHLPGKLGSVMMTLAACKRGSCS